MAVLRQRLLTAAGTFTTASSLDWSEQFNTSTTVLSSILSNAGEFEVGVTTYGCCVDFAVTYKNPTTLTIYIEASVASPLQVQIDGALTEWTTSGSKEIVVGSGYTVIKFTRATGPMVVRGALFDPFGKTSQLASLYPAGSAGSAAPSIFASGSGSS